MITILLISTITGYHQEEWRDLCCYEKGRIEKDGIVTILYYLEHENLQVYQQMLQTFLSPKGSITLNEKEHLFMVKDAKENIEHVEKAFKLIHGNDLQVMIESKIVEIRWDKKLEIGFEGGDTGSLIFIKNATSGAFLRDIAMNLNPANFAPGTTPTGNMAFAGTAFRFRDVHSSTFGTVSASIRAFLEKGQAHILTNPSILLNHHGQSEISSGEQTPFLKATISPGGATAGIEYIDTGTKLTVKAHIISKNTVKLTIQPEVNTISGFATFTIPAGSIAATTSAPIKTIRKVVTEVIVEDGDEIVIGGLLRKEKVVTRRGVPFLMDIPIIGYLFSKYEERDGVQEIMFLIRPKIIKHNTKMKLFDPK